MKDHLDLSIFPPKSQYKRSCKNIFFSYLPNNTNFQQGYLGVQQTKIAGILHVRRPITNPLLTDKIEIIFTGKEFVKWSELEMCKNVNKKIIELSYVIWESSIKGVYQKITDLDLPFEIPLPDDLPDSLFFKHPVKAQISYSLKAKFSKPTKYFGLKCGVKKISILCPITRWNLPVRPTLQPIPMNARSSIPPSGGVEYVANLDQTIFGIGNSIIIPIELILKNMRVYVKKIKIFLKEYHQLMRKKFIHYNSEKVVKSEVYGDQLMLVSGTLNRYEVKAGLDLITKNKRKPILPSVQSDHIVVWHKVKVKVILCNAPKIKFEKEIRIVNSLCGEDALMITEERRKSNWSNWSKMDKLSAKAVYNLSIS
ncbi:4011_t:CDS:1 [Funneliformis mosseae]|uniref:4011_t:CDS:1 n=1 Tax=Funneliformis mosseae TaxID=27381 RepID=A0A9N9EY19_FUNMO|nr:4011_t:CDS:1 [Funneliformis mosseae]